MNECASIVILHMGCLIDTDAFFPSVRLDHTQSSTLHEKKKTERARTPVGVRPCVVVVVLGAKKEETQKRLVVVAPWQMEQAEAAAIVDPNPKLAQWQPLSCWAFLFKVKKTQNNIEAHRVRSVCALLWCLFFLSPCGPM